MESPEPQTVFTPSQTAAAGKLRPLLLLTALLPLLLLALLLPASVAAQASPTLTVDDECTTLAYAPDGRIAYAVKHILTTRRLEIQRDDIWVLGTDGKRKRIVNGEKLVRGPAAFSYAIQALRWAPDSTRLTVEMLTSRMINERGDTEEGVLALLIDDNGKEIRISGADSVIPEATNAAWLGDGVTVVYLAEAVKPKLLYSIQSVRPVAGRGGGLFADHVFAAVAWNAKQNSAVGGRRHRTLSRSPTSRSAARCRWRRLSPSPYCTGSPFATSSFPPMAARWLSSSLANATCSCTAHSSEGKRSGKRS